MPDFGRDSVALHDADNGGQGAFPSKGSILSCIPTCIGSLDNIIGATVDCSVVVRL
jgi:hypothetical protein